MNLLIEAIDYYLPKNIVTNKDLEVENPEWDLSKVENKTGVKKRCIARKNETAFDLSVKACEKIFKNYDINSIDGIIYCTQSPDYIMPSNAFLLHKYFQFKTGIFAYDFNHACTGYIYCLSMANAFFKAGMAKKILIVNSDTYSKYINKKDRSTRALFGDGAAVTIVKASQSCKGIIDIDLASSGINYNKFWIPAGGVRSPKSESTSEEKKDSRGNIFSENDIQMNGMGVWSFINSVVPPQIEKILRRNDLRLQDIEQFIFHQASLMTLESVRRKMQLPKDKVFTNLQDIGNTVSASIPIALKDADKLDLIREGSKIVLSGFGVGLSYGAILMEY